jgi:hypothetical protein
MKEIVCEHNQPYLKRLYNSLGLWIFIYLMIISSGFYIIAVDFSFEPYKQMKLQSKNVSKSLTNPSTEPIKINNQKSISSNTMVADDKRLQSVN